LVFRFAARLSSFWGVPGSVARDRAAPYVNCNGFAMTRILPPQSPAYGPSAGWPVVLAMAALAGVLTAGAAVLWMRHGTAVFLHTIMSGIAACL
jgi:hypothetical protein